MILTLKQQRIIQELGRYKYLTVSQFLRLGVDKHRSNLSTAFKRLTEGKRPLVKVLKFGLIPTKGRVEALYYLTSRGAELVEGAKYPRSRTVTLTSDYFHRVVTIDCEIALYSSSSIKEVSFSHRYFDHTGSNRTGNRKITTALPLSGNSKDIIADWVFMINTGIQDELYCAEIYMDDHDTTRPFNSLQSYLQALHEGAPNEVFDFDRGTRVLAIFNNEGVMERVIQKLQDDPLFEEFVDYFLFRSFSSIRAGDLTKDWIGFTGEVEKIW
jgi:hypothetical protein